MYLLQLSGISPTAIMLDSWVFSCTAKEVGVGGVLLLGLIPLTLFPLSSIYLAIQSIQSIHFLKALLMRNTLKIKEVPSKQDLRKVILSIIFHIQVSTYLNPIGHSP